MQPYHPGLHGARPAGAPQYGMPVIGARPPVAHYVTAVPAMHAAMGSVAVPSPLPATPVAHAPPPAAAKGQPAQLWNLPRFQPPAFEGANGALPCPDSPGSTPRDADDDECQVTAAPATDPSTIGKTVVGDYVIGSLVEYKSRSSGLWILARVEGFDDKLQTYRLDVQPNAKPERIRPRTDAGALQGSDEQVHDSRGPGGLQQSYSDVAEAVGTASPPPAPVDASTEALRREVAQLQERLAYEIAMKERYYAELCACREQLQRASATQR